MVRNLLQSPGKDSHSQLGIPGLGRKVGSAGCPISAASLVLPVVVLITSHEFCRQGCGSSCRQDAVSKFCHVEMRIVPSFAPCVFMRSKKR